MHLGRLTMIGVLMLITCTSACQRALKRDESPVVFTDTSTRPRSPPAKSSPASEQPEQPVKQQALLVGDWPARVAPIDLQEHGTPVREVIKRFARVSLLNFVIHDEVRGSVTMSMSQVPWTLALQAILHSKDLVAVKEGNVIRILPREDWNKEQAASQ